MLEVEVNDVAGAAVCHATGDLDAMSVSRFRQAVTSSLGRPGLVIDLSDLHFIDGAGLSALVGLIRRARERRSLVAVASDRGGLRNALEHAGLDLIVNLWAQTDDALAEVRSSQI